MQRDGPGALADGGNTTNLVRAPHLPHKTRKTKLKSLKWRSRLSNRTVREQGTFLDTISSWDLLMRRRLQPIRRIRVAFGELPSLECLELGSFRSLYHAALGHIAHSGKLAPAAAAENAGQHRGRSCAPRSAAAVREFCEPVMGCWR